MMENGIPAGAVAASVLVLLYSTVCLGLSILLTYMLCTNGEKGNYITIIAIFISTSSLASITQQIYYATHWRHIQEVELQRAKASLQTPSIGYTPLSTGFNLAMFELQYYCYCVVSMLIFFWAAALAKGMYNLRFRNLTGREVYVSAAPKVFAVCIPGILIGLSFTKPILERPVAYIVLANISLIGSLALGSVCVVAILFRYIHSRHRLTSLQASGSQATSAANGSTPSAAKIRVDKVLLLRFTVGFLILSAYEVVDILIAFTRMQNSARLAQQSVPDYSLGKVIQDILIFIPGVTGSLICFLLFGTTAHFREQYVQAFRGLRFWGRRRPSLSLSDGAPNVWNPLNSRATNGTYQCSVRAGDTQSLELQEPGLDRRPGFGEKTYEDGMARFKGSETVPLPKPFRLSRA